MSSKNSGKNPILFKESVNHPPKQRREMRLKKIIECVREGPKRAKEIPHKVLQTLYNDLNFLVNIRVLKRLPDHRWAWIDFSPLEEEIEAQIEQHRKNYLEEPTIERIAVAVGRPPENGDFTQKFYKVASKLEWRSVKALSMLEAARQRPPPMERNKGRE